MFAENKNSWVTWPKPSTQARLRLFCFPYAGGGASIFRTWPDDLPPRIEVCPVQLPGRESWLRGPLLTRHEPLIELLVQVLRPHLQLPFAFFGQSLCALIAFELARTLFLQINARPIH